MQIRNKHRCRMIIAMADQGKNFLKILSCHRRWDVICSVQFVSVDECRQKATMRMKIKSYPQTYKFIETKEKKRKMLCGNVFYL